MSSAANSERVYLMMTERQKHVLRKKRMVCFYTEAMMTEIETIGYMKCSALKDSSVYKSGILGMG
jgi:hypothetical protein